MRFCVLLVLLAGCRGPCDEYASTYCRMYADCVGLGGKSIDVCERDFRKQLNAGFHGSATEAGCNAKNVSDLTCQQFREQLETFCTGGKFQRDLCWSP